MTDRTPTPYFMDYPAESTRLTTKVDALEWIERYYGPLLVPGQEILDVGCGSGILISELARRVPAGWMVGLDRSEERLDVGRRRMNGLANLSFVQGDAVALPFDDNSFDAAYTRFLLEYLPEPEAAIGEMVRVTRPGGTLILQDLDGHLLWHYPIDPTLSDRVERVLAHLSGYGFDPFVGRKLYHFAVRAGLTEIIVRVDPYHLYAGRISDTEAEQWRMKLDHAHPAISHALGGEEEARRFGVHFMEQLYAEDRVTYSVVFTVVGRVG